MSMALAYSLAVAGGLALAGAGLLAAWRLIPRPDPPPDISSIWAEVQANRLAILEITDKFETALARAAGRAVKQRKKDDEPEAPRLNGKDALRARARARYPELTG